MCSSCWVTRGGGAGKGAKAWMAFRVVWKDQMFSVSCVKEPVIQLWEIIPFIYCSPPSPPHFHSGLKGQSTWRDLTLLVPPSGEKEQLASGRLWGVCLRHKTAHVQKKKNERKKNRSNI